MEDHGPVDPPQGAARAADTAGQWGERPSALATRDHGGCGRGLPGWKRGQTTPRRLGTRGAGRTDRGLHAPACPAAASGLPRCPAARRAPGRGAWAMLRALSRLGARPPRGPPAPLLLPPARGRKTRHDPPAKSKVGRVATPPAVDPAEFFVLTERYRQYRETVRALRLQFVSEVRRKKHEARAGVLAERKAQEDASEHRELMAWNLAENQRLHELRVKRLQQEAREKAQRQAEEQARQARETQAWVQLKEQEVLQLQEEAKHFITRENLEARIEEALDSPKDYNWAVTREGLVVRPQHKGS
ncbi:small ribosomal subunit protein mS26 isoform 2-T2 [Rhynchonycteris naso]